LLFKTTPSGGSSTTALTISSTQNATFAGTDFGFGTTPGGTPAGKNVFLAIGDSDTGIVQDGDGQLELWANNNEVVHFNAIDGYVSTKPISTSGDITASGGAGAITLAANSDIRMANGTWTGDYGAKIQHHDNYLYLQGGSNGLRLRNANGSRQVTFSDGGAFKPDNTQTGYDLGASSHPWDNVYADNVHDSKGNLRSIPIQSNSGSHTLAAASAGKVLYTNANTNVNNSVFSAGDAVTIVNNSGSDQTITQGSGLTLYNTADASTGNRTLASRGMATIWFASASVAYISGAGLS
jgi:hypothetical protein